MEDLNRIELRGTVGNVSVIKLTETSVAHVSLRTDSAYKDKDGNSVIDTAWHYVTIWEGKDRPNPKDIGKGDRLHVTGRVRVNRFTGIDGGERTFNEVIANKVEIVKE